jgi:hypothetical protein
MAFTVATAVCVATGRSPAVLPSIFASVAGEIQTTDLLCTEIVKADGVISPSAFHNSVQNTASGYWCIARQCTEPTTALAAGLDTLAMALLEAWCQLSCFGGELLLVCYDEIWPNYLAPKKGDNAFACALLLAAGELENSMAYIGKPHIGTETFPECWQSLATQIPVLSVVPLLSQIIKGGDTHTIPLSVSGSGWQLALSPCS